jgi:hypothetical protein
MQKCFVAMQKYQLINCAVQYICLFIQGQQSFRSLNPRNTKMFNFDEIQKATKDNAEKIQKSATVAQKTLTSVATEVQDYAKTSFEANKAAFEKFAGVKTFEAAVALQTETAKANYEAAVAKATKIGEIYADFAKEMYKPFEAAVAQATKAAKAA